MPPNSSPATLRPVYRQAALKVKLDAIPFEGELGVGTEDLALD